MEVRLIGDDNEQIGVVSIEVAFQKADAAGLDLVLVADKSTPCVCRLMDFKKRQYEAKRAQREAKKKQHVQKVKEMKFHVNIDPHDFGIKINRIGQFLGKGHKVKCSLFLRGREMGFKAQAMDVMKKVVDELVEIGVPEAAPKFVNRSINMMISPLASGKKKAADKKDESAAE